MPKIKRISFFRAISPLSQTIADSTHQIPEIAFIVTRLELDNGITGDTTVGDTATEGASHEA